MKIIGKLLILFLLIFLFMEVAIRGVVPAILAAILFAAIVALFWIEWFWPEKRIQKHLYRLNYEKAWSLACKHEATAVIRNHLLHTLAVPNDTLRSTIVSLFDHLTALRSSASDPKNHFVDADFRDSVVRETDSAMGALWKTFHNLEVVSAQGVEIDEDHPKMLSMQHHLDALKDSTEQARQSFAELSLGTGEHQNEEAELAMRVLSRQAEVLGDDVAIK